jgi:predicted acyltransferase
MRAETTLKAPPYRGLLARVSDSPAPVPSERLVSLDALRGFDMFWIVGADGVVGGLGKLSSHPWVQALAAQMDHKEWEGFGFYDLIFPLFVFIAGVSIVLALSRVRERPGLWRSIVVRGLLLFLMGLVFSGGIRNGWSGVRIMGVLQRIALAYTVAALLYWKLSPRALAAVCASLLLGYWALCALVPVRDISLTTGPLQAREAATGLTARQLYDQTTTWVRGGTEQGRNLPNHIDFRYLPGRKYDGAYDPEGLLSTLPAIASCLLGVLAGLLLRRPVENRRKVLWLLAAGVASLVAGHLWSLAFPIIKQLWTSSYVLVAAGWSALLLALFLEIVDVRGHRRWATPFVWIGMNPITLYMARRLVDFGAIAERFVGGPVKASAGAWGPVLVQTTALLLLLLLARFLYQRKIFLRL